MEGIVLVIHLLLALTLIGLVLMQRSEGGALGIGGGGGGMGGFLTARGSANLLTRATAVVAALFIVTSLSLAIMAGGSAAPRDRIGGGPAGGTTPATGAPQSGTDRSGTDKSGTGSTPTNTAPIPKAPEKK
jgi:preprotein translocase subunit SecG